MLQLLLDDANTSPGQTTYLDGAAMKATCFQLGSGTYKFFIAR